MGKKKKMKTRTKLWLFQGMGLLATFAPILCEILIHKDTYFATKEAGMSLTIGGAIAVLMIAMAMVGKLSKYLGSGIRIVGTVFVLSMLLEPILLNFKLLSFLLLCGMCVDGMFFKPQVKRLTRKLADEGTANVLKEALNGK